MKGFVSGRVVFTDLDGTLLDAITYRADGAIAALEMLEEKGIPLIFCSSKTRAEVNHLREWLGNRHPFIVENGGGIFVPGGYFSRPVGESVDGFERVTLGLPYREVRARFVELRERVGIAVRGFGDMDDAEVAERTGLSLESAHRARMRDFEEPFVFMEGESAEFLCAVEEGGLHWTRGRLFHLMGDHDKGKAVVMVKRFFGAEGTGLRSIGLGDGLNDLPMLREVDDPVLIRHPDGGFDREVSLPNLFRTHDAGPAGWNEAIVAWLSQKTVFE